MFSTPQSKAFFSQQIIKGKLITQQMSLINIIHDKVWETKSMITQINKILWQPKEQISLIEQKLKTVSQNIENTMNIVSESNEVFSFQVSLRGDIKQLQHTFFKQIMILYEQRIKDLKHGLLLLEHDVQKLQQKGYLPYIQNPSKNQVLICKTKFYQQCCQKIIALDKILNLVPKINIEKVLVSAISSILNSKQQRKIDEFINENSIAPTTQINNRKQVLDVSQYIQSDVQQKAKAELTETLAEQKSKKMIVKNRNVNLDVNEMLKILQTWMYLNNVKLKKTSRILKQKIQSLNHSNKILKQSIRNHKNIINYEKDEANVRQGKIQLTRQEAIDFLREMNEDLQRRFGRRNIYMIITNEEGMKKSKSCTYLKHDFFKEKQEVLQLRQIDSNLNDSFLQKCGYLISDRFIGEQDQNEYVMV